MNINPSASGAAPDRPAPASALGKAPAEPPRHPAFELLSRYRAVLSAAWRHRAELAGPSRLADETAFLPAALSLQETPMHPAPRRLAWGLMLLFVLALAWSIIGQVDIVAVAPGRIIVSERTKVIQPLEYDPWNSGMVQPLTDGTFQVVITPEYVKLALGLK